MRDLHRQGEIEAKIIELDKNRNSVVLSRRAWLEQIRGAQRVLINLQKAPSEGNCRVLDRQLRRVRRSRQCGRLVHVSELSWKHIDHLRRGGPGW